MRYLRSNPLQQALGLILGIAAAFVAAGVSIGDAIPWIAPVIGKSCDIKGNISIGSGEKIYHVPGQEHYSDTRIRNEYGERWFCNEPEARAAGWRKART